MWCLVSLSFVTVCCDRVELCDKPQNTPTRVGTNSFTKLFA
jgi:hypothetical protein